MTTEAVPLQHLDSRTLQQNGAEMENAIVTLLHGSSPADQKAANTWLTSFIEKPLAWSVALYVAFPPSGNNDVGRSIDVRFFALSMLLNKMRSDSGQLSGAEQEEIFSALWSQISLTDNNVLKSRLCIVIAAICAMGGSAACYELVDRAEVATDFNTVTLLLIGLAEEVLIRARNLSWEIGECLQECCPVVLQIIERHLSSPSLTPQLLKQTFVCLLRWQPSGVTLSELATSHPSLFTALLSSLSNVSSPAVAESAAEALASLIAEVDLMPGRNQAVEAVISALVSALSLTPSAPPPVLSSLVATVARAEASLLCQGGEQKCQLIAFLVHLTASGAPKPAGRDFSLCSQACEAWPRVVSVPAQRRAGTLQGPDLLSSVLNATLSSMAFSSDPDSDLLTDDFLNFRETSAAETLSACYIELGPLFLRQLAEFYAQPGASWQMQEASLFALRCASKALLATVGAPAGTSSEGKVPLRQLADNERAQTADFLAQFLGSFSSSQDALPEPLLQAQVSCVSAFCSVASLQPSLLQPWLHFLLSALSRPSVGPEASTALSRLCQVCAPHPSSARALLPLMDACQQTPSARQLAPLQRARLAKGVVQLACALPEGDQSRDAIWRMAQDSVVGLQRVLNSGAQTPDSQSQLASEANILAAILESLADSASQRSGSPQAIPSPLSPLLQTLWPLLQAAALQRSPNSTQVSAAVSRLCAACAGTVGDPQQLLELLRTIGGTVSRDMRASSLHCFEKVLLLPLKGARAHPEVLGLLQSVPVLVTGVIPSLEQRMKEERKERSTAGQRRGHLAEDSEFDDVEDEGSSFALQAAWKLLRTCLHCFPESVLMSATFGGLCRLAKGFLQSSDAEVAKPAARFLADVILGAPQSASDTQTDAEWRTPSHLLPAVDAMLATVGSSLLEDCVRMIAKRNLPEDFVECTADVVRSLCVRHSAASRETLTRVLSATPSIVRNGPMKEGHAGMFVNAATREASITRARFRELMKDFSKVAKGLASAENFEFY